MERFVDAKAIAAFAFMLKPNWSGCTAVGRRHLIVRYGTSSLCGSCRGDFGTRSSAGSVFSPLPGAVGDSDIRVTQSIMMESLLSATTDMSLPVGVVIKSLSRGLAIFPHRVQGA
jgi:hypothetical protein